MDSRRGRPPKAEGAKRSAIAVRTTEETKYRITQAAEAAGRSLTQEIEQMLELALSLEDEFGGRDGIALHRRIAWGIKQAERQAGSRWTDSPIAFWMAVGAIEGAVEELQPPYTGAEGETVNQLYFAREQAQQDYDASYEKLKARFPIQSERNALLPLNYPFEPRTIADYRYDHIMTDEELSEAVNGMAPADEALVREHQEKVRALKMAEVAWKFEIGALIKKEEDARQRAKDAVRRERRHITETKPATRI